MEDPILVLRWNGEAAVSKESEPIELNYEIDGDVVALDDDAEETVVVRFSLFYIDLDRAIEEGMESFDSRLWVQQIKTGMRLSIKYVESPMEATGCRPRYRRGTLAVAHQEAHASRLHDSSGETSHHHFSADQYLCRPVGAAYR
ncbi:MAG: hypothetical protein GEV05_26215 [Betaproteobacteria bacterium]|nr:hypothetical protein [Betaproteobacteria bacterium]